MPFAPGHPRFEPHTDELGMVAGQVPLLGQVLGFGLRFSALLLDPSRNPGLIFAAGLGYGLNYGVIFFGGVLEYVTAPALGAVTFGLDVIIELLRIPSWFSGRISRFRDYLISVVDMINVGTWSCHNLYAASQGRAGNWNGNIFVKLLSFRPRR